MDIVIQILTMSLGVLAIIWHQQKTINKLRDDTSHAINKLRDDTSHAINKLRDSVTANGERLARIEGFLHIDTPKPAVQATEPQATKA